MNNSFRCAGAIYAGAIFAAVSGPSANAQNFCGETINPATALSIGVAAIYDAHAVTEYFSWKSQRSLQTVQYNGVEDFLARNPGCCTFTPLGQDEFAPTPEWSERNSFYGFVRAKFKANLIEDTGDRKAADIIRIVAVTKCGKTIWYDIDDDDW